MKKLTKEEFINKYEAKYGKKYLWDLFEYSGNKVKSIVICQEHGPFEIRPNDLLNGTGCDWCGGTHKYTTEEYQELIRQVHHNFYNVDNIVYSGGTKCVFPECPAHGPFKIRANRLLRGCCCSECIKEGITHEITPILHPEKKWSKDNTESFINKVISKYGDKYILDKVDYVKNSVNVLIGCKKHGYFPITPNHLLAGEGCPECAGNKTLTTETFIQRSQALFPDELLYDKTQYVNYHTPLTMTCLLHGDFSKSPSNHFKGQSCPACSQSKLESYIFDGLSKLNIVFEREKKFKELGKYRYDFYLPKENILIECQGIQHFEKIDFFERKDSMELRIERDIIKNHYAIRNGYTILYLLDTNRDISDKIYKGIYSTNIFFKPGDIIDFIKNVNKE